MKEKRLMDMQEAAAYIGMGTVCARQWLGQIGAVRYFGRRVLFDRAVIDKALNMTGSEENIADLKLPEAADGIKAL